VVVFHPAYCSAKPGRGNFGVKRLRRSISPFNSVNIERCYRKCILLITDRPVFDVRGCRISDDLRYILTSTHRVIYLPAPGLQRTRQVGETVTNFTLIFICESPQRDYMTCHLLYVRFGPSVIVWLEFSEDICIRYAQSRQVL